MSDRTLSGPRTGQGEIGSKKGSKFFGNRLSDFGMVFRSRFFLARNGPISACCRPGETLAGQARSVFSSEKLPKRTQWVVKSEKPGSNQYREHVISRWKQTISKYFQGCKHSQPCHKSENPVFSASKSHVFSFFTRVLPPPREKLKNARLRRNNC